MVFFSRSCLAIASLASLLGSAVAVPMARDADFRAPHWVVYSDTAVANHTGPPDASSIKGYNVVNLGFLQSSGAYDQAGVWASLNSTERKHIKTQYALAGIKLVVSVFGGTELPTTQGVDPKASADSIAKWVKQYDLDGVDVVYEDTYALGTRPGEGEDWLIDFTTQLRSNLPAGRYVITHAPQAALFTTDNSTWQGGAYLTVDKAVGKLIDWYNVQFYNLGKEYTTCDGLLTKSSDAYPNTSVFEIAASGVDLNKIVIGKPSTAEAAASGFVETDTLAQCLKSAKAKGWSAGAFVWQFPEASSTLISAIRALSWPH